PFMQHPSSLHASLTIIIETGRQVYLSLLLNQLTDSHVTQHYPLSDWMFGRRRMFLQFPQLTLQKSRQYLQWNDSYVDYDLKYLLSSLRKLSYQQPFDRPLD